jgi:hypothetical protein
VQNLDLRSTVQLSEGVDGKGSAGRTSTKGMCVGGWSVGLTLSKHQFLSCKAKAEFPSVRLNICMTVCIYIQPLWMESSIPVWGGDQGTTVSVNSLTYEVAL